LAGGLPLPLEPALANGKVFCLESKFRFDDFGGLPLVPLPLAGFACSESSLSLSSCSSSSS
jgi:hypothetical protein